MAGYDTASLLTTTFCNNVQNKYGNAKFWVRYFSPSPDAGTTVNSSSANAIAECTAAWNSGGHYLGTVSAPTQSRLSGTAAEGNADAQTFAVALWNTWLDVTPLNLPSGGNEFYNWLDQESGTSLSASYWNAWAGYLDGYEWFPGQYPLFPSLYCKPCASAPNCSVIGHTGNIWCWAVWASEPELYSYCPPNHDVANPPACNPEQCSDSCAGGYSTGPSALWQFVEKGGCSLIYNVDFDEGCNGINYQDHCFNISSKP